MFRFGRDGLGWGAVAIFLVSVSAHSQDIYTVNAGSVYTVRAPKCPGSADLTKTLARFDDLPVSVKTIAPNSHAVHRAIRDAAGPWLLFLFSGHGKNEDDESRICLEDGKMAVRELVEVLSSRKNPAIKGAVIVLNACESATVDPSKSAIPLSIISASPWAIQTDALFGESLGPALRLAAKDRNCDGVITDQELFDALLLILRSKRSPSLKPALPKLRRQASAEIPLPIAPEATASCNKRRDDLTTLVGKHGSEWGELGRSLKKQLSLAHPASLDEPPLPGSDRDFYVVSGDPVPNPVRKALEGAADLASLPKTAVPHAEEIAAFMTFADIYRIDVSCGYVRVYRLSDNTLYVVSAIEKLTHVLPHRQMYSVPRRFYFNLRSHWRVLGAVDEDRLNLPCHEMGDASGTRPLSSATQTPRLVATPCYEQTGQCFWIHDCLEGEN